MLILLLLYYYCCCCRDAIDPTSVVLVVTLPSDAEAARVFRRAVLIKYYLALWNSPDCGNLHDACNDIRNLPATYLAPYLNVGLHPSFLSQTHPRVCL